MEISVLCVGTVIGISVWWFLMCLLDLFTEVNILPVEDIYVLFVLKEITQATISLPFLAFAYSEVGKQIEREEREEEERLDPTVPPEVKTRS